MTDKPKLTQEEWEEQFRPIVAHGDTHLFETYGSDIDRVHAARASNPNTVWTLIEEEGTFILAGYHYVNREGYYITEVPWTDETMEIVVSEASDEDSDQCAECGADVPDGEGYEGYCDSCADALEEQGEIERSKD